MHMVDLQRTDDEKAEARMEMYASPMSDMPDVPSGLCICLTEAELEKLDLDDDAEVGDYLHGRFMAKVTSIAKNDSGTGAKCRIELSIVAMSVDENESTEDPAEDEDDD
jgi:hypothetical protein